MGRAPEASAPKHHPATESLTQSVERDCTEAERAVRKLAQTARALAAHDSAHGARVHEAAAKLEALLPEARRRVTEMRQHLEDGTD